MDSLFFFIRVENILYYEKEGELLPYPNKISEQASE